MRSGGLCVNPDNRGTDDDDLRTRQFQASVAGSELNPVVATARIGEGCKNLLRDSFLNRDDSPEVGEVLRRAGAPPRANPAAAIPAS